MSLALYRSDDFWTDMLKQVDWYRDHASPEVAERYIDAVEFTLGALVKTPALGRRRFVGWPELAGIRSWKVQRPFQRHLIFYRFDDETCLPNESCMDHAIFRVLLNHPDEYDVTLPKIWEETKMLKHGGTVMRFLKLSSKIE